MRAAESVSSGTPEAMAATSIAATKGRRARKPAKQEVMPVAGPSTAPRAKKISKRKLEQEKEIEESRKLPTITVRRAAKRPRQESVGRSESSLAALIDNPDADEMASAVGEAARGAEEIGLGWLRFARGLRRAAQAWDRFGQ